MEIYDQASNELDKLEYENLPKYVYQEKPPYSSGAFITNPLIHYLIETNAYTSHGSGDQDFGVLLKSKFDIPENRFIMIDPISDVLSNITYVVEDMNKLECAMMSESDYDMRVVDALGKTTKTVEVTLNFAHTAIN